MAAVRGRMVGESHTGEGGFRRSGADLSGLRHLHEIPLPDWDLMEISGEGGI